MAWQSRKLSFAPPTSQTVKKDFFGRDLYVFTPAHLPPMGSRALVVVLHGGLGNAARVASGHNESAINMNGVADKYGFVVAYLDGTQVVPVLRNAHGWNAGGGCCGMAYKNNVNDVDYITKALVSLISDYGIDRRHIYGLGHSNGAIMSHRMICETGVYAAIVAVSGPIMLPVTYCPAARGKRILDIHGVDDASVPVDGGYGNGRSDVNFNSEEHTRRVYFASKAQFTLDLVPDVGHKADDVSAGLLKHEGVTLQEKAAQFFGLAPQGKSAKNHMP